MSERVPHICKRCGLIRYLLPEDKHDCSVCGTTLSKIPEGEEVPTGLSDIEMFARKHIEWFPDTEKLIAARHEWQRIYTGIVYPEDRALQELQSRGPKCPICNSTNITKISAAGKVAKVGFFGLFGAGDVGKTYKCNNCGSKF